MDLGILAYGGYLPKARLQHSAIAEAHAWFNPALASLARGERTMANWDEDSVAMAVEAARDCLTSAEGEAARDIMDGVFDSDGKIPCQFVGGLKCFCHRIGASGMRMIYEMYLQMNGHAGERQRDVDPTFALTHNLGGFPHQNICSLAIVGRKRAPEPVPRQPCRSSAHPRSRDVRNQTS